MSVLEHRSFRVTIHQDSVRTWNIPDEMYVCQIRPSDNRLRIPAEKRRVFSVVEGVVLYLATDKWTNYPHYLQTRREGGGQGVNMCLQSECGEQCDIDQQIGILDQKNGTKSGKLTLLLLLSWPVCHQN
jgi:hypothetical protein